MIHVRTTIQPGAVILASEFALFGANIRSFRAPLERARDEVGIPSIKLAFATEGRSQGEEWTPLAERTQAQRIAHGFQPAHPILRRTNKLYNAATAKARWKMSGDRTYIAFDVRSFPARAKYSEYHLTGTKFMPQRSFLSLTANDADEVQRVFASWAASRAVLPAAYVSTRIGPMSAAPRLIGLR